MHQIDFIASLLTEDPDLFCEAGMAGNVSGPPSVPTPGNADLSEFGLGDKAAADKPLDKVEIEKQADEQTNTPDASKQVADQLKQQQDVEKQQQQQRQEMMQPQLDQLQQAMTGLNTGILQSQQASTASDNNLAALQKEMGSINTLIGGLGKQIKTV